MTRWFGSGLAVIPNLVRDLGFELRVLKPRLVGGVLYFLGIFFQSFQNLFRRETIHHPHLVGFLCLNGIRRIKKGFHPFFLRS